MDGKEAGRIARCKACGEDRSPVLQAMDAERNLRLEA